MQNFREFNVDANFFTGTIRSQQDLADLKLFYLDDSHEELREHEVNKGTFGEPGICQGITLADYMAEVDLL